MLQRNAAAVLTSPALRDTRRAARRIGRRLRGGTMKADFFLQIDDPYGPIALHYLVPLCVRHGVAPTIELVPPPDAAAAPEPERLSGYARRDAAALADALGLPQPAMLSPTQTARANRIAAAALSGEQPIEAILALLSALASADIDAALEAAASKIGEASEADSEARCAAGAAKRARLGHYLGAVTHFEGEFYWGVDRLHYLESRLDVETGCGGTPICPLLDPAGPPAGWTPAGTAPRLDFYLSFRSPYSMVAAERVGALAEAYGADLRLRFVLPMVMRGLPVPGAKRMYITLDTKREAVRHGIDFGRIVDPVGAGVERGLAVLHHAMSTGQGLAYAQSFLRGAWAEGIDMTEDAGLMKTAARAGLSRELVDAALADESWRDVAEANRTAMFALGLWGVPSFQVDDRPGWWGQDRLWRVEDDLRAAHGLPPVDRRP